MFWPCETRTSTCLSFATISSGLYRFLAIAVLLDVKDIPQVGPLQWGWINPLWLRKLCAPKIRVTERLTGINQGTAYRISEVVFGARRMVDAVLATSRRSALEHHKLPAQ